MKTKERQPFRSLPAVVVGLAVIAATGLARSLYTAEEKRSFHTETSNQLTAIADMKVRQLVAWREERLGDAKVIQFNPLTHRAVRETLDNGRDRGDIEKGMGLLMEGNQYIAARLPFWEIYTGMSPPERFTSLWRFRSWEVLRRNPSARSC